MLYLLFLFESTISVNQTKSIHIEPPEKFAVSLKTATSSIRTEENAGIFKAANRICSLNINTLQQIPV